MSDFSEIIFRLREDAEIMLGHGVRRGMQDASISGHLADKAADTIEAQAREIAALTARAEAAEARVALLVGAVKASEVAMVASHGLVSSRQELSALDAAISRARAALAEIGGGNG